MRNPFGSITKVKTTRNGKKVTAYDAVKRYTNAAGEPARKFKRCSTRAEAETQLLNFKNEIADELATATSNEHTFAELTAFYKQHYIKPAVFRDGQKISGFRRNLTNLENSLELFNFYFGAMKLRSITYGHIYAFKIDYSVSPTKTGKPPAVSTINDKLTQLRRIFYIGIQKGWLEVNPFRQGDPVIKKAAEAKRNRMLTFDEEERLIAACRPHKQKIPYSRKHKNTGENEELTLERFVDRSHLIPLIICALDTAMRRGEIFDLEWWQIDMNNRVLYIKEGAAENTKTGFGGVLPISNRLYTILEEIRIGNLGSDFDTSGSQLKVFTKFEFKRAWISACKEAKIKDLQFRDLRSTGATRMVLAGNSESQVMKVTRHQNLKIFLDHYSNVDILNAQRIGRNLSEFVENRGASSNPSSNQKTTPFRKAS